MSNLLNVQRMWALWGWLTEEATLDAIFNLFVALAALAIGLWAIFNEHYRWRISVYLGRLEKTRDELRTDRGRWMRTMRTIDTGPDSVRVHWVSGRFEWGPSGESVILRLLPWYELPRGRDRIPRLYDLRRLRDKLKQIRETEYTTERDPEDWAESPRREEAGRRSRTLLDVSEEFWWESGALVIWDGVLEMLIAGRRFQNLRRLSVWSIVAFSALAAIAAVAPLLLELG